MLPLGLFLRSCEITQTLVKNRNSDDRQDRKRFALATRDTLDT